MQAAIQELQDAVVVLAHIEKRQSEMLKDMAEWRFRTEQNLAEITEKLNGTEQNLAEIAGKLNGLIGYLDGRKPS